jgi:hypothetical protein
MAFFMGLSLISSPNKAEEKGHLTKKKMSPFTVKSEQIEVKEQWEEEGKIAHRKRRDGPATACA